MSPADSGFRQRRSTTKTTLVLGVLDQPYASGNAITTGEVAQILEAEYGIMRAFVRVHGRVITEAIESSVENAITAMVSGHRIDPWGAGLQKINQAFRVFINSGEAERVGIPGTPTQAALKGVNHRRKHPYRKSNPRRPSFLDTGLYSSSFRSWVK